MTNEVDPKGAKFYKTVLGKDAIDPKNPAPLTGVRLFTVNHLFANVWSRCEDPLGQVVSLRERRLVTIALLAAQRHTDQLKTHVCGARRTGLTEQELTEVMIHVAHYAGWAAGANGQQVIRAVFEDKECKAEEQQA